MGLEIAFLSSSGHTHVDLVKKTSTGFVHGQLESRIILVAARVLAFGPTVLKFGL